jgi:hypothetical protein
LHVLKVSDFIASSPLLRPLQPAWKIPGIPWRTPEHMSPPALLTVIAIFPVLP